MPETKIKVKDFSNFLQQKNGEKRLLMNVDNIVYQLYPTVETTVNLRNYNHWGNDSLEFKQLMNSEHFNGKALIVAIEKVKSILVEASEADIAAKDRTSRNQIVLDTAILYKNRIEPDMKAFKEAIEDSTRKLLVDTPKDHQLFAYLRMFATKKFVDLGDGPYLYKFLRGFPNTEEEIGWFVVWQEPAISREEEKK